MDLCDIYETIPKRGKWRFEYRRPLIYLFAHPEGMRKEEVLSIKKRKYVPRKIRLFTGCAIKFLSTLYK